VTVVASALAVLLVSGASLAAITAQQLTSSVTSVALGNETAAPAEISAMPGGANILLIGSDRAAPWPPAWSTGSATTSTSSCTCRRTRRS
jgi:hypothetical protein